jgi:hypothetical protein
MKQPRRSAADTPQMTWWTIGLNHTVLELDAPAIELDWLTVGGCVLAWWADENGCCLVDAVVGVA